MAAITWYLTNNSASIGSDLSTSDPGAEAYRSPVTGWIVGTGSTNRSEYYNDVERASSTFVGTTVPDGSLDTTNGDFWVSPAPLTGDFTSANWNIYFACRANTVGGTQDGLIYARIFKGANQDGTSATEVTSAATAGSAVTDLTTTATQVSTVTVNPGAFSLANEYVFIQLAWGRTGAGGMTTSDVNARIGNGSGTGSRVVTADFAPTHASSGALAGTGAALSGTATRTSPAVSHPSSGTLAGTGATLAGTAAKEHPHATSGVLAGTGATLAGTAAREHPHPSSGVLQGTGATLAGTAAKEHPHASSGVLQGTGATLSGSATRSAGAVTHDSSGALAGAGANLAGTAAREHPHPSSGILAGTGATLAGTAAREHPHATSGILAGTGASLAGSATVTHAPVTHATSGVLQGDGASLVGVAATPVPAPSGFDQVFFMPRRRRYYEDEEITEKAQEVIEEVVEAQVARVALEDLPERGPSIREVRAAIRKARLAWRDAYAEAARQVWQEEMEEREEEEILLLV